MTKSEQQITLLDPGTPAYQLILKDGTLYQVTQEDIEVYKLGFPLLDLDEQLRLMVTWCYSNKKKRKSRGGIHAFMNSWLSRAKPTPRMNRGTTSTRDTSLSDDVTDRGWAK